MTEISLKFWHGGSRLQTLRQAAERWWREQAESWLRLPAIRMDMLTADRRVVDLVAWERGIEPIPGETERLYRLRVHHAFVNALDAGTPAGMQRIFARLEIPIFEIEERMDDADWDMISITMGMEDYQSYNTLLQALFGQYGRTCRRWMITMRLNPNQFATGETLGGVVDAFVDDNEILIQTHDQPSLIGIMLTAAYEEN